MSFLRTILNALGAANRPTTPRSTPGPRNAPRPRPTSVSTYPGDFTGIPDTVYAADPDGRPDPGEIVWAWVPFEEDYSQGKDRPVLLIGRDETWLLGLALTSKDHHRDAEQERRAGRLWFDLGSGPWDARGRESEVRINRILRVDARTIRREGAILDESRFDQVVAAMRTALGGN